MTYAAAGKGLSLTSRARYTVQLQGVLDPSWADRLGGMQIVNLGVDGPDSVPVTVMTGDVADQAALAGILNTVYMLGLPLLSVTFLGHPETNCGQAAQLD
ncbi:MAG: hypothetical protein ACK2U5_08345 [Candidatus Promineifilaceae bacterium]|jgi:hypothetical protein